MRPGASIVSTGSWANTCLVGTLAAVGLVLAGCAGLRNTPQQNYVYAMARQSNCEARGVTLHNV
jgi:hypothetical protein